MAEAKAVRSKYSKDSTSGIIGDSSSHSADIDSKTEPLGLGSSKPSSCFSFTEVKGDLFSCPESSSLAHCVSADLAMGKGVAVLFKRKFGGVAELKAQGAKTGGLAVLKRGERYVYYLVTKPRYFHKPTYETLRSSLLAMKEHCLLYKVHHLCLPRIGCGLDRLQWDRVVAMMMDLFGDVDINITVYYL